MHVGEAASDGSIPAGAGEPRRQGRKGPWRGVYPRGCGGAGGKRFDVGRDAGLSPRVRGSRLEAGVGHVPDGSIPAGAGEPDPKWPAPHCNGVYPRGCGGARDVESDGVWIEGLSPRVRGSRRRPDGNAARTGSIPAGAGEPYGVRLAGGAGRVYPRGCGGAKTIINLGNTDLGLSPRVRGRLCLVPADVRDGGSIPAGAGETFMGGVDRAGDGVYPRGCGGDSGEILTTWLPWGLSPRVRGRPRLIGWVAVLMGSIPAGAGETPA